MPSKARADCDFVRPDCDSLRPGCDSVLEIVTL